MRNFTAMRRLVEMDFGAGVTFAMGCGGAQCCCDYDRGTFLCKLMPDEADESACEGEVISSVEEADELGAYLTQDCNDAIE